MHTREGPSFKSEPAATSRNTPTLPLPVRHSFHGKLPPSALHRRFPSSSYTETILQPALTTSHHRPSCYLMSKYGRLKLARSKSTKIQLFISTRSRLLQLARGENTLGNLWLGAALLPRYQANKSDDRNTVRQNRFWNGNHEEIITYTLFFTRATLIEFLQKPLHDKMPSNYFMETVNSRSCIKL